MEEKELEEVDAQPFFGEDKKTTRDYLIPKKSNKKLTVVFYIVLFFVLGIFVVLTYGIIITNLTITEIARSNIQSVSSMSERIASTIGVRLFGNKNSKEELPKLVVMITVDQLRSDLIQRLRKRFSKDVCYSNGGCGGLNYFFNQGTFFRNAHYRHSITITPVGHSSLFTGGNPATHGILHNEWIDYSTEEEIIALADSNYTEIDGKEDFIGVANSYMESTTIGDELILFNKNSKMFGVSRKDRGAIFPSGKLGKALWYSDKTGNFVSSTKYWNEYPQYVKDFNARQMVSSYYGKYWSLSYDNSEYHFDQKYSPAEPFGKAFPKELKSETMEKFYEDICLTPMLDKITSELAKEVITNEQLGKRGVVDLFSLSLSMTDYIQHKYGPNSLESEDNLYKLDKTIESFLKFLDDYIGLDNVLFTMQADHGTDMAWEYNYDIGFHETGRIIDTELVDDLNNFLNETFNGKLESNLINRFIAPNIYFYKKRIKNHGFTLKQIEDLVVERLMGDDRIYFAFSRTQLLSGGILQQPITEKIARTFHPKRSGNVLIVLQQHVITGSTLTASHGSSFCYDTYVPIFFVGKDIPKGVVSDTRVGPEDIAPTLSAYFGVRPPSGNLGNPLSEVLKIHDVNQLMD